MLFDLRGRGRRRTIQAIYLFLAILMGGGLVFFGVGGTGVGVLNNDNNNGTSSANPANAALKAAVKGVKLHPRDARAWGELARQRFLDSKSGKNYNQDQHAYTASGLAALKTAATAWNRYLALNPKKTDTSLAILMSTAFGLDGLQDFKAAVTADEALTTADPKNAGYFAQLAVDAALAGQTHKSDQAEARAVELTPKAARKTYKTSIETAKSQALQQQQQATQQPTQQLPGG